MLNRLGVQLLKAVRPAARVVVVVKCDLVEPAAPRISGRLPPIDPRGNLGMEIVRIGAQPGRGLRRITRFDGRVGTLSLLRVPVLVGQAALDRQPMDGTINRAPNGIRLLETEI